MSSPTTDGQSPGSHRTAGGGDDGAADLLRALRRHFGKALFVGAAVGAGVVFGLGAMERPYEAEASLLITFGREFEYRSELANESSSRSFRLEEIINSEVEILRSTDLAREVIATIGLDELYPDLKELGLPDVEASERAVSRLRASLRVKGVARSSVIRLAAAHADPKLAARVLNVLVESFKDKHLEVFSDPKAEFLEARLHEYRGALQRSEDRLEAFVAEHGLHDVREQRRLRLAQRVALDSERMTAAARIAVLQDQLSSIDRVLTRVLASGGSSQIVHPAVATDRSVQEAQARLLELQLEEADLLRNYADTGRTITSIRREIGVVKVVLGRRKLDAMNVARTSIAEELASEEAAHDRVGQQLEVVNHQLTELSQNEKEHRQLLREVTTNERNYETYLAKFEEAGIAEDLDRRRMVNIKVIQDAAPPVEPKGLSRKAIALSGLVSGFMASFGMVLLAEQWSLLVASSR